MYTYTITPSGLQGYPAAGASTLDEFTRLLPPGFYTTFRTYDNRQRVLGLRSHLSRLYEPAARQGICPPVDSGRLRSLLTEALTGLEGEGEGRVRLVLTRSGEMYLAIEPLVRLPPEVYSRGVGVITVALHRSRPDEKATDFISASQEARRLVQERGAFEALMVHRGRILEGLTSNFFYVHQEGWLGTAGRGILPGVTRQEVIHLARQAGLCVRFRSLRIANHPHKKVTTPNIPNNITECFLTSSSRGVVPIVTIDAQPVGTGRVGPLTQQIGARYEEYVQNAAEAIIGT